MRDLGVGLADKLDGGSFVKCSELTCNVGKMQYAHLFLSEKQFITPSGRNVRQTVNTSIGEACDILL